MQHKTQWWLMTYTTLPCRCTNSIKYGKWKFSYNLCTQIELFCVDMQTCRYCETYWCLGTAFLWVVTQRDVVIWDSRTLSLGPIVCLESSVRNYHYSLSNNPEERSSQLLRAGSLKSRLSVLCSEMHVKQGTILDLKFASPCIIVQFK
jgi:hypothetical protein